MQSPFNRFSVAVDISHFFKRFSVLKDLSIVAVEYGIANKISRDIFTFGYKDSAISFNSIKVDI